MYRSLILAGLGSLALTPIAHAGEDLDVGILEPRYVEPPQPDRVKPNAELLPRGVSAAPPREDGAPFAALVEPEVFPVRDGDEIRKALAEILPGLGLEVDVAELALVTEAHRRAGPDLDALMVEAEMEVDGWREEVERRVGPLSQDTIDLLTADAKEAYERAATPVWIWRFQQRVEGARVLARVVTVEVDETGLRRVSGALLNDDVPANERRLDAEKASTIALSLVDERASVPDAPELVAIPSAGGLLLAWLVTMETEAGPYEIAVDAATGDVLQIDPQFWSVTDAVGAGAIPGMPFTVQTMGFEVDDADDCDYTLGSTDFITFKNKGADGYTGTVKACLNADGEADFDVAPINDTTNVIDATASDYNGQFAHVNLYAWVTDALDFYASRGAEDIPAYKVYASNDSPCSGSRDNACGNIGFVSMGIGSRTLGSGSGLWNTALDASVILHEVAHGIDKDMLVDGGGTMNGSLSEGMCDYWAFSRLENPIIGVVTRGTTSDTESGGLPRQADIADVFPDHLYIGTGNSESHANGQVVARALWASRQEMEGRSPLGNLVNDQYLMASLESAGDGQSSGKTDREVHDAFQGLLLSMIVQGNGAYAMGDVLVGFAQAGLFDTEIEAVIDIDQDILDADEATPPTFTVWTGRDFGFNGDVVDNTAYYATNYEIEVASDPDFTENLWASGDQSNVAIVNGVARASLSLDQAAWDTLRKENELFFRVTAWNDGDGDSVRTSTHTYGEWIEVLPGRAIINHADGGGACSSAPGRGAGLAGLLVALGALLRRRR